MEIELPTEIPDSGLLRYLCVTGTDDSLGQVEVTAPEEVKVTQIKSGQRTILKVAIHGSLDALKNKSIILQAKSNAERFEIPFCVKKSDTDAGESDQPNAYILQFSKNAVGMIYVLPEQTPVPEIGQWSKLREASGIVKVPQGFMAKLGVYSNIQDLSSLKSFEPNALAVVTVPMQNAIDDSSLEALANLSGLRRLYLGGAEIGDSGLRYLSGLHNLEHLDLQGCSITDSGLLSLRELSSLKSLWLFRTKVSEKGIADLKKNLPQCRIFWKPE
jgi:Leucine-rich repeat (LRR) protein